MVVGSGDHVGGAGSGTAVPVSLPRSGRCTSMATDGAVFGTTGTRHRGAGRTHSGNGVRGSLSRVVTHSAGRLDICGISFTPDICHCGMGRPCQQSSVSVCSGPVEVESNAWRGGAKPCGTALADGC